MLLVLVNVEAVADTEFFLKEHSNTLFTKCMLLGESYTEVKLWHASRLFFHTLNRFYISFYFSKCLGNVQNNRSVIIFA